MNGTQTKIPFIEDHKTEVLELAEPALKVADHMPFQGQMHCFSITEEQYKQFIIGFIKTTIEDKKLQAKMLEHFDQFSLCTWTGDNKPDPIGSVGPQVDANGQISKINRVAYMGRLQDNGLIETDFKTIRVGLHELFHSVSAKHDMKKANNALANKQPMMRDSSLGEVESLFSEMLFSEWLSDDKKIDKLRKNGVSFFGLPNYELKQDAKILKAIDLDDFVKRSNSVLDENIASNHNNNEYWYRYTKGYVVASTIREEYNKNSRKTMKHLSEFLEFGNEMGADEAVAVFFGKYKKGAHHKKYNFDYSKEVFKRIQESEYEKIKGNPLNKLMGADLIRSNMPQIEELDNSTLNECRELLDGESVKIEPSYDNTKTQSVDVSSKKGQENQQER